MQSTGRGGRLTSATVTQHTRDTSRVPSLVPVPAPLRSMRCVAPCAALVIWWIGSSIQLRIASSPQLRHLLHWREEHQIARNHRVSHCSLLSSASSSALLRATLRAFRVHSPYLRISRAKVRANSQTSTVWHHVHSSRVSAHGSGIVLRPIQSHLQSSLGTTCIPGELTSRVAVSGISPRRGLPPRTQFAAQVRELPP